MALKPIGDIGAEEADLVAAIISAAGEFEAGEFLPPLQPDHRVGNLDLTARTRLLLLDLGENLGLQDVAAGDDEVRRCRLALRLLDHRFDRESAARPRAGLYHAITMHMLPRHFLDRDDI